MGLQEDFDQAKENLNTLTKRPSDVELLNIYALFKQSTEGDVSGKKPGMMDFKGRAKFEAWEKRKGLSKEDAMKQYIDLVNTLMGKYK